MSGQVEGGTAVAEEISGIERIAPRQAEKGQHMDRDVVAAEAEEPLPILEQLSEAADAAKDEHEVKAVLKAFSQTPGLAESPIAPDVLEKLLPDEEIVELPELKRVAGAVLAIALRSAPSTLLAAR